MAKIEFNSIKDTHGELLNQLVLKITGGNFKNIKQLLTLRNKSIEWQMRFLKKKITYWQRLVDEGVPGRSDKALGKLKDTTKQLEDISPKATEELYTEEDNALYVPPGLWFLCENIKNAAHENTEIKPYYLPELRDYQREALSCLYKYNRGVLELFTGAGKSRIIHSISIAAINSGKRVMIIVPSEYLVGQMFDQLKSLNLNATAQGGGRMAKGGWDVLVTTVQSAGMYIDIPHVLVTDENHHAPSESLTNLLASAKNATHVYGLTATAIRGDGLDMAIFSFCGPVVFSRDVKWGVENKWLNPFTPISIQITPRYSSGPKMGKPIIFPDTVQATTAYKVMINSFNVMSLIRERIIACVEKERKPIIIYKTVEACKNIRKFCKDSVDMDVASAQDGKKSKIPLVEFQKGDSNILLSNSGLISEGVDLVKADTLIQCCNHSSDIMTLQSLGRILRLSEGKKNGILLDISVSGFGQFERARDKRNEIYEYIVGKENLKIIKL